MSEKSLDIGLTIHSKLWLQLYNSLEWETFFQKIIHVIDLEYSAREISILLTSDKEMQYLNGKYRQKNTPTNVLAFPSIDFISIGDIVLSYETIDKQAKEQNKPLLSHLTHLFIHGFLHLLGYDHEQEEQRRKDMEEKEITFLKKLKIENPYVV